jgi:cyclophilin family peptidyl-prolyl cis-trans isomerase
MRNATCLIGLALLLGGCAYPGTAVHKAASLDGIELLHGTYNATIHTEFGNIELQLYADKAPKAVTNFVELAKSGFYDGLTFHRTVSDFVIQGGDPRGDGTGGMSIFKEAFDDEQNDLPMKRGAIAMANKGQNTNLSQFFIVQSKDGTPWLQGKHTAFGTVTKGLEIVDKIATIPCDSMDRPLKPITFNVTVE